MLLHFLLHTSSVFAVLGAGLLIMYIFSGAVS
jgi:hypothetical protein